MGKMVWFARSIRPRLAILAIASHLPSYGGSIEGKCWSLTDRFSPVHLFMTGCVGTQLVQLKFLSQVFERTVVWLMMSGLLTQCGEISCEIILEYNSVPLVKSV